MMALSGLSLFFDAAMILLLVVAIGYAMLLNSKLAALRDAKNELLTSMIDCAEALTEAEKSMASLREAAESCGLPQGRVVPFKTARTGFRQGR